MGKGSGYTITVEGQYFVKTGEKGRALKSYSFDINLPSMDSALSVIKNHILDKVLRKKYPDYCGYRTHDIVNVKAFGNVAQAKAVLWQMNRPTVISYIREQELPVKEHIYEKLMDLRQAVESCEADLANYLRIQDKREEEYNLLKGIAGLNPELEGVGEEKTDAPDPIVLNNPPPPELHTYNTQDTPKAVNAGKKADALADFMD
jgi:hypothetical protein